MNKKRIILLSILTILLFTSLTMVVYAASPMANAASVFDSIFGYFGNIADVYGEYSTVIDLIIYLILFMGLAKATLPEKFKGGVQTAIGLMLAISLTVWEAAAGFNIASFGPFAAMIAVILLGFSMYKMFRSFNVRGFPSAVMGVVVSYFALFAVVPQIFTWLNEKVPAIGGILSIVASAGAIYLFYTGIRWVINWRWGRGRSNRDIPSDLRDSPADLSREQASEDSDIDDAISAAETGNQEAARASLRNLAADMDRIINITQTAVAELDQQIKESETMPQTDEQTAMLNKAITLKDSIKKQIEIKKELKKLALNTAMQETTSPEDVAKISAGSDRVRLVDSLNEAVDTIRRLKESMVDIQDEIEKEKKRVKKKIVKDIAVLVQIEGLTNIDHIKRKFKFAKRAERQEYRLMGDLLVLLKKANTPAEELNKIIALNNFLVDFLSRNGEIDKAINANDITKVKELSKKALEYAEALSLLLKTLKGFGR